MKVNVAHAHWHAQLTVKVISSSLISPSSMKVSAVMFCLNSEGSKNQKRTLTDCSKSHQKKYDN